MGCEVHEVIVSIILYGDSSGTRVTSFRGILSVEGCVPDRETLVWIHTLVSEHGDSGMEGTEVDENNGETNARKNRIVLANKSEASCEACLFDDLSAP